jgi:hypothetical protein
MSHKLANDMKMWKGNGNTTILLFSQKILSILHKERKAQVKTIVIENFKSILFHKSELANNQHTRQSINKSQNNFIYNYHSLKHIPQKPRCKENWSGSIWRASKYGAGGEFFS